MPPIGVLNYRREDYLKHKDEFRDPPNAWTWYAVGTPRFLENIKTRNTHCEHVDRFSKRFLDVMDEWLEHEVSAWSECLMPTLCMQMGFKGQLIQGSIAYPYSYRRQKQLEEEHFEVLRRQGGPSKFVHPVKF